MTFFLDMHYSKKEIGPRTGTDVEIDNEDDHRDKLEENYPYTGMLVNQREPVGVSWSILPFFHFLNNSLHFLVRVWTKQAKE